MKNAPSSLGGNVAGRARRVTPRRAAFAVCVVMLAAVLACVALVTAQSPAIPVVATVRHAPTLNGRVEGSVWMLTGEYLNLNSGGVVKGDLLVPGTPTVVRNGTPIYQGTIDGSGSASPSNYGVTLNSGSEVRYVRRRTDPVTLAPVPVPPAPAGTRYVTINSPGQSVGTWATVRNLTLNSNVGSYAVPAGTYGNFTANGGGSFVLGTAGATQAAVYNFEDITLNSLANLNVVGPVVVNVANRVSVNSSCVVGSAANPQWLALNVSRYDVTINGGQVYGVVRAPAGSVNLSAGTLKGEVFSDRLTVNGGTIVGVPSDTTPPTVAITQPAAGFITKSASVNVTGTFNDESATTVKVNNVAATVSGNSFNAVVPLVEGPNTIQVVAADAAGNQGTASRQVSRDTTAPSVSITQPAEGAGTGGAQVTVAGTFSDASPTTVTVNGSPATLSGNGYTAAVALNEGQNAIEVVATDSVGNSGTASRTVLRDSQPPAVSVGQPLEGQVTNQAQVVVNGTVSDASAVSVSINGAAASVSGNTYSGTVALAEGENTIRVVATDALGNSAETSLGVTRDSATPVINLDAPASNLVTTSTVVTVHGTVTDATRVSVSVTGGGVTFDGETFTGQAVLPEGVSQLRVVATDAAGNQTEVTRTVTADETAPVIGELSPAEGSLIASTLVTVEGSVTDVTAVSLSVGGVVASVDAGGHFSAHDVPLAEGENTLLLTATDAAGNKGGAELTLRGKDMTPPATPRLFAAPAQTRLSELPVEGVAEPGTAIHISGGAEQAATGAAAGTGLFVAPVKLAAGANTLTVTATDAEGNVSPAATLQVTSDPQAALPPEGQPSYISVSVGDTQRGLAGAEFPRPLVAVVTDRAGAPVPGVTVRFNVMQGGGHFVDAADSAQVQTDAEGYARARYVAGATPGPQLVRADFDGHLFAPVTFSGETFESSPARPTTVSGVVRDMNMRALPNVLVRVGGQQAHTGADGRFLIGNVSAGPHQLLELIGRDQITLPGRWPNISYDLDVLPGMDNDLGRPLFLPKVNGGVELPLDASGVVTRDTVYELPVEGGEPPVRVTAREGTHVTFPPDVTDKRLSVTRIPAARVPMPLEDGRASNLYISVQPSGALFDPPLEVSFPNIDRLPAGSPVLLMSFDHDAGRYVQNGTGSVSADGRSVTSAPGSGIRVGAWHSTPPPPPQPEVTMLAHLKVADNPKLVGRHIDDVTANAYGTTGTVLTPRPVWHSSAELLIRFRFNVPRDNPPLVQADVETPVSTPKVKLEEVSFDDNYSLRKDDDSGKYDSPHWTAPAQPDPAYKGEPVAYEDGKKMKVAAKFSLAAEIVPSGQIMVRADGNDAYDIDAAAAKYDKKEKRVELKGTASKTAFAKDTIDYFEAMSLKWEVALDGQKFEEAGTSSNQLYVTLSRPLTPYHTTVHLATKNLKGLKKDAPDTILTAIWNEFSDRQLFRASDPSTKLTYWGSYCNNPQRKEPPDCFAPVGVVKNGDARCEGWQEFFIDVLRTQGISASPFNVVAKRLNDSWFSSVVVKPQNLGQGELPNPPFVFNGHAIVKSRGKLYDPSYGTGPFNDLKEWENASLLKVVYRSGSANGPVAREIENKPDSQETEELVAPPPPPVPVPSGPPE